MVTEFTCNALGIATSHNLGNTLHSVTKNQSDITKAINHIAISCNCALKQVFGDSVGEFQFDMKKIYEVRTMFKLIAEIRRQLTEFILNICAARAIPTAEKVES